MPKPLLVIGDRNYSSWSLRAWLVAAKAGIEFDVELIPLDTREFEQRIGEYSPTRRVPVLHDGDLRVWDSLAIAEYLNERHAGGALWPADVEVRAHARAVSAEMHAGFEALREHCSMNWNRPSATMEVPPAVTADVKRINEIWRTCRAAHRANGDWLFGRFSIADAMYAPVVLRYHTYRLPADEIGAAYMATVLTDPDVRAWLDGAERERGAD